MSHMTEETLPKKKLAPKAPPEFFAVPPSLKVLQRQVVRFFFLLKKSSIRSKKFEGFVRNDA